MPTLNSKSRIKANAAATKMIDKYGHDCTIIVSDTFPTPVPATCLFTKNDLSFADGTLIINNNYKIIIKTVTLPALLAPGTKVMVNGATLTALKVSKITPDGVNAIVWEVEAAGQVLPNDASTIAKPSVTAPANNTSYYASTEGTGGWIISCQGSAPNTTGDAVFSGSEWQIATDAAFTSIVSTGTVGGTLFTTGAVLARNTNYYVRTRYTASVAGTTDWSDYILFSLDEINTGPVTHITKPTILNTLNGSGEMLKNSENVSGFCQVIGKYPYATTNLANVVIRASDYNAVSAGVFSSITFQIATDAAFTDLKLNLTQTEGYGYDPDAGTVFNVTDGYKPEWYVFSKGSTYYARMKYTSADPYDSEWSDTLTFIVNEANT